MELKKRSLIVFFLLFMIQLMNTVLYSQAIPQSVNNTGIYDFIDELANSQIILVNSAIKPYSRLFIAQRLKEAKEKRDLLNLRQQKELDFYLLDFGKEMSEGHNGTKAQWLKGEKGTRGIGK